MNYTAIFQGGGIKGLAYIGALIALEENGFIPYRAAGTSIGSFFASLTMAGYSGKEMLAILEQVDLSNLTGTKSNFKNTLVEKGIYSIDFYKQFTEDLLQRKNYIYYKDTIKKGIPKLKVLASDITNRQIIIFPDDLYKYNIDYKNFPISLSVAMSSTYPGYFKPLKLVNNNIIDGGIYDNFPYRVFSYNTNELVIGFVLNKKPLKNIPPHIKQLTIDTSGTKVLDFKITKDKIHKLINQGYNDALYFINNFINKIN